MWLYRWAGKEVLSCEPEQIDQKKDQEHNQQKESWEKFFFCLSD